MQENVILSLFSIMQESYFLGLIVVFILVVIPVLTKNKLGTDKLASLLVTIGILGTFIGVTLGLLNFNVNDISGSIPTLLAGLKTAFVTSIAGMLGSIILKIRPSLYGIYQNEADTKSLSIGEQMLEQLKITHKSLVGDEEGSLVGQFKLIRVDLNEGFRSMNSSFKDFADKVVADSTQSLIDALNEVIKDFNTKVNEQFGENFKQLNEAMGKILDWQKAYGEQVDQMVNQFSIAGQALEKTESHLADISEKSTIFTQSSAKLNEQLQVLDSALATIKEIGMQTTSVLPSLQNAINEMTEGLSKHVKTAVSDTSDMTKNFGIQMNDLVNSNKTLSENQRKAIDTQLDSLASIQEELKNTQNILFQALEKRTDEFVAKNMAQMNQQLADLDQKYADELSKSISALGNQLTALSGQFVKDYQPLVEVLRNFDQSVKKPLHINL